MKRWLNYRLCRGWHIFGGLFQLTALPLSNKAEFVTKMYAVSHDLTAGLDVDSSKFRTILKKQEMLTSLHG